MFTISHLNLSLPIPLKVSTYNARKFPVIPVKVSTGSRSEATLTKQ
jgi:hypothetical protein